MNFNDPAVLNLAETVANSIQVVFDTNSTSEQRHNATVFCEEFRSKGSSIELCTVGFIFVSRFQSCQAGLDKDKMHTSFEPQLALVGMKFVEDVVKYRWPQFDDRAFVKAYIIQLMRNGLSPNSSQIHAIPHYLHEMIARIIVEIAKREWPQFWPDLFPTLLNLLPTSDLPLLILRRLAEDVFVLQRVDSVNRRRDLSQCLHVVCDEVLSSLFSALQNSLVRFQSSGSDLLKRRVKTIVETIQPFVEWSKISCFTSDDRMNTLFSLLITEHFRMEAADCITELVERKTFRKEERYDIPNACLSLPTFSNFLNAAVNCETQDEEFLKKLGNILTVLGTSSLGVEDIAAGNLMKGFIAFASRNEAVAVLSAIIGMSSFMKMVTKELVNTKDWLKSGLIKVLELIIKKCTSPPVNSERREVIRIRQEFPMLLRKIGKAFPDLYLLISSFMRSYMLDPSKVEAFQFDALVMVMGSIQAFVDEKNGDIVKLGLQDLELCFTKFATGTNLKTKSFILSCVSALFVFLSLSKRRNEFSEPHSKMLHSILEEMFNCFPHDNVSQHAASLMVKLSVDFPELLLPYFDTICASAIKLMPSIKPSDYQRLVEALIVLSNQWNDPSKQAAFIGQLINPQALQHIAEMCKAPQRFVQMFQDESLFVKERFVLGNLHMWCGILRRAKLNINEGSKGQPSVTATHPAFSHFIPVISTTLEYIRVVHSLVQNPDLKFIMDVSNSEMCQLMGITHWSTEAELRLVNAQLEPLGNNEVHGHDETDPLKTKFQDVIKRFIRSSLESAYGIIGHSFCAFTPDVYAVPEIGDTVLQCVAGHFQLLDDYKLYVIVRNVFKPFFASCPLASIDLVLKPFLQKFLPFMLNLLQARWIEINKLIDEGSENDIKEVLESCALKLLSKEFMEIVLFLLGYTSPKHSRSSDQPDGKTRNDDNSDAEMEIEADADVDYVGASETNSSSSVQASEGATSALLTDPICSRAVLHLSLTALSWGDKLVGLRASRCIMQCWPVISKDPDIIRTVFIECLRGILSLDDPETRDVLLKIILLICSMSLGKDPSLAQILLEWGATESDVKKLQGVCQSQNSTTGRSQKDCLKKMVRNNPNVQSTKGAREKWLNNLPKIAIYNLADKIEQIVNLNECVSEIHE